MANFNPQKVRDFAPANAKPIQMKSAGSPQLGGERPLPGNAPAATPAGVAVGSPRLAQRGASAAPQQQSQPQFQPQGRGAPSGARPVAMLGSIHPASAPEGWSQGIETHRVEVVGEGPDGTPQVATFDAEFPSGTKILGVRHAPI